jgi:NTE family protein
MSLLTGEPASADVVATTTVKTYAATPARLASLGELRTRLVAALSTILAGRLKHANERLLRMRPANTHVICCTAPDMAALAGLPEAMARTASPRVLVFVAGQKLREAASAAGIGGYSVRAIDDSEYAALPALLERSSREHDEVLLLGEEASFHQVAADVTSMLHIVREQGGKYVLSGHQSPGQLIVIGRQPWTPPSLRRLSDAAGHPVVAVLPPDGGASGSNGAVARLARTMLNRRVGLALGAGAAKGLAHLGVLRALEEMDVPIDVVAGCSIGSAVAAGLAAEMSIDELSELTQRAAARAIRPTLPIRSFLSNAGIRDELKRLAGDLRIEDLSLPLAIVATDLYRRSEVTFTSGLLWPRLLASMAIPGVYPPSAAMGSYLVDGGVLQPVPVEQCRMLGAGIVIGVRLTASHTSPREMLDFKPSRPLAIETIMRTFEIMLNRISEHSHEPADVNIEVQIEGSGGVRDFKRGEEIAAEGHRAAWAAMPALSAALPYIRRGVA